MQEWVENIMTEIQGTNNTDNRKTQSTHSLRENNSKETF